jgi:hypothetical protein
VVEGLEGVEGKEEWFNDGESCPLEEAASFPVVAVEED